MHLQPLPIRIGTSNIVLPGNKQTFPAEFRQLPRLTYYASLFNTLEVNSSFYKVPLAKTFAKWSSEVPDDFRFSVKLWQGITHVKDLAFHKEDVMAFMKAAAETGNKKGCLLIQFPASITIHHLTQVHGLLQLIRDTDGDNSWSRAVEFRHMSWYNNKVYEVLDKQHCANVLHDMSQAPSTALNEHATTAYLRFHGTATNYSGTYTPEQLQQTALQMINWQKQGKQVYAYFNNTLGSAFEDARQLVQIIS